MRGTPERALDQSGQLARGTVETALGRDSDHITRVEVHLTDEDGHKSGQNDKCCVMEARLEGRQPIAVSDRSETLEQAVNGAADP